MPVPPKENTSNGASSVIGLTASVLRTECAPLSQVTEPKAPEVEIAALKGHGDVETRGLAWRNRQRRRIDADLEIDGPENRRRVGFCLVADARDATGDRRGASRNRDTEMFGWFMSEGSSEMPAASRSSHRC